ncbi:MAG: UbiH/UbiF/VisC/COQ6 family ubiquinone biosynthesis hydroxylase [Pseudomonadota bacterium]
MRRTADIVIVGGGITGLTAALALGRYGIDVVVLEARSLPDTPGDAALTVDDFDSRVSALTPKSIDFLDRLNAWERIEDLRHCPYSHMTVWDAEGTGEIEFDAREVSASSLGSIVENRVIVTALARVLEDARSITAMENTKLAAAKETSEDEPKRFCLALEDGQGGTKSDRKDSALYCDLLIVADGALSPTRKLLAFETREWSYEHHAIVTTAEFEHPHRFTAWQRFLQTGPLALLPLADTRAHLCSIVWSCKEAAANRLLKMDDSHFSAELTLASERVLGSVKHCSPRLSFPLYQRHAIDYVKPGVALVGDAAHSIHPLAGQGVNLGLADVEALAEELGVAKERNLDFGSEALLKRYQRKRKGDNLLMMAAMDGFKRLFEQEAPALRWMRNAGMQSVAAVPAVKRRIIRQAMGVGL